MATTRNKSRDSTQPAASAETLVERARTIHQRVLTLDTHVDFNPADLAGERNYAQRLDTQFNLPKMIDGGLDGLFFVVYVGQTRETQNPDALKPEGYARAYARALEKFAAVRRFTGEIASAQIDLALGSADVRRINSQGKKVALIGVENGYPLGEDAGRVKEFYERGARYLSLTHNGHNQLADSHTGERDGWKWHGVSPLGKQVIAEMNRLGIMIDVSHASKAAMLQTVALSRAPVIASHSSVRALCDVSRNLDDEQLLALRESGGVLQVVAYADFIRTSKPNPPARAEALAALRRTFALPDAIGPAHRARFQAEWKRLSDDQRAEYQTALAELDVRHPGDAAATVEDFVDHIDYAVNLIGIDHVGISSDFDGGGGVEGWNDASETFNVTLELVRHGYTEDQIEKLWSGNLLRGMDEVERMARELQK
jgi:membrane dipeptidase